MNKGFTLVELLIVITVIIIIAALTVPVGVNFYRSQVLDETTSSILTTLRRAQAQSLFQKNDGSFGVRFLSGSYVLFQGSSYTARIQSEDEIFTLSGGITTSGIDEIVFAKLAGSPNTTGTLTITSGDEGQSISINAHGKVERQ